MEYLVGLAGYATALSVVSIFFAYSSEYYISSMKNAVGSGVGGICCSILGFYGALYLTTHSLPDSASFHIGIMWVITQTIVAIWICHAITTTYRKLQEELRRLNTPSQTKEEPIVVVVTEHFNHASSSLPHKMLKNQSASTQLKLR